MNIKNLLKERLAPPKEAKPEKSNRIPSAVIIPFCEDKGKPHLLFLKKVDSSYSHGGQVCFPGGCYKAEDGNLLETALREFEEETGVSRNRIEILGSLRPIDTRSTNFTIYPFVGFMDTLPRLRIDRREIEKYFFVPLEYILKRYPFKPTLYRYRGVDFETYLIPYQGEIIWGATARILKELMEKIAPYLTGTREPPLTL